MIYARCGVIALRTLAPVAKLDKALVYETSDYRFESCLVRHGEVAERSKALPC